MPVISEPKWSKLLMSRPREENGVYDGIDDFFKRLMRRICQDDRTDVKTDISANVMVGDHN